VKILAIDTATTVCGLAVAEGGRLLAEYRLVRGNIHNERLVGAIEPLLDDLSWTLEQVDGFAVSIGPGSFTGLRIGLAVASGLAFSLGKPLAAVNTLDAFASGVDFWPGQVCVALAARASEVYAAVYENAEMLERKSDYLLIRTEELAELVHENTLLVSSPIGLEKELALRCGKIAPAHYSISSAANVARLGLGNFEQGNDVELNSLEPFYLKDFVPKQKKQRE